MSYKIIVFSYRGERWEELPPPRVRVGGAAATQVRERREGRGLGLGFKLSFYKEYNGKCVIYIFMRSSKVKRIKAQN